MSIEPYTVAVLAILFLAALVRSTFGFADALVAMPLLAFVPGIETSTFSKPLVALIIVTTSGLIVIRSLRSIEWRSAAWLIVAAAIGIPIGLQYLTHADPRIVKGALGLLVVAFSAYMIWEPRLLRFKSDRPAFLFGLAAGILGGAYNTHGPPLAIYGTLRGWSAEKFRGTLQAYFFPASLLIAVGDGLHGLWTPDVMLHFAYSLPLLPIALLLGHAVNSRVPVERFRIWLNVLLLCSGVALLVVAFR